MTEQFQISFEEKRFSFPEQVDRDYVHGKIKSTRRFYEVELLRYLASHVSAPGVAIDCGANIGNHTLFFSGVMGLRTLAVEPVMRNLQILEKTVDLNGLADEIDIIRMALDEEVGELTMVLDDPGNLGTYSVGRGDGPYVKATTLDTLTRDVIGQIRLIKIDVEGFQDRVIRGATDTLKQNRPLIAAELSSTAEYRSFSSLIAPFGYVPVAVFNRTPTIVFCADQSIPENRKAVEDMLKSYDKRMQVVGPIMRLRATLRRLFY